jgi:hypothetical protein
MSNSTRKTAGEVDTHARWNTCTQGEADGTEPFRSIGYTEPAACLTRHVTYRRGVDRVVTGF